VDTIYDAFMIAVCAMLIVTAVAILRAAFGRGSGEIGGWQVAGAWGRIRAVARVTIAEGIRMKIAVVFIVLLVGTLPLLCLAARGDGTVKGQVQMFIGYSLGLTSFYLALLTIFFSSRTLANEISTQQIHILAAKPVPRWQIIVGKWTGIMALNALLVAFAIAVTYVGTRWIVRSFERSLRHDLVTRGQLTDEQAADCIEAINRVRGPGGRGAASPIIPALAQALGRTDQQVIELLQRLPENVRLNLRRLDELRRQVLVARAAVKPDPPDIEAEIDKLYESLRKDNRLPTSDDWPMERIRGTLRAVVTAPITTILPLGQKEWTLRGPVPKADDDFLLAVRYKIRAGGYTPELTLPNGLRLPENTFVSTWIVGDPKSPASIEVQPPPEAIDSFHEFEVPNNVIEKDGRMVITLINRDPRRLDAMVPLGDGLEVLYRVGSFEENLLLAGLATLVPLALLAALGLLMSTFCTFPVAALVCLVIYGICSTRGLIAESLSMTDWQAPVYHTRREQVRVFATNALFQAASLGQLDPSEKVLDGRAILGADLLREGGQVVGLRTAIVLLVAILVFRRRELAAVIV
jgi:hypothetical protein